MCKALHEDEPFHCGGDPARMLILRVETRHLESVLEVVKLGYGTLPNSHASFVQLYMLFSGTARIHMGEAVSDVRAPAAAFDPQGKPRVMCTPSSNRCLSPPEELP